MKQRVVAVPAACVAALLLSGCAGLTPGTAATVNGTRISTDEVDRVAAAQCDLRDSLVKNQMVTAAPASRVGRESLGLLMDTTLATQFGESEGLEVDSAVAANFLSQVTPLFEPLPAGSRETLTRVFTSWADSRALLVAAGAKATGQQVSATNLQQLLDAGLQARDAWLADADIDTDPRFGPNKDGYPAGENSSVSEASSSFAKSASATEADPAWVAALPTSQKCG